MTKNNFSFCLALIIFSINIARGQDGSATARIYLDKKNGYFTFLPPKGWAAQAYPDPRTKVAFSHTSARGVFIRLIVREAPDESFDKMVHQDKRVSQQMRKRGISCKVDVKELNGLKVSEVRAQFPHDRGTTMLRKFLSCGLHFNIQYSAPTKSLFDRYEEEVLKSLETVTVLKRSESNDTKAKEQKIAGRIRLAELTAEWVSAEEGIKILKEAQDQWPDNERIQQSLEGLKKRGEGSEQ